MQSRRAGKPGSLRAHGISEGVLFPVLNDTTSPGARHKSVRRGAGLERQDRTRLPGPRLDRVVRAGVNCRRDGRARSSVRDERLFDFVMIDVTAPRFGDRRRPVLQRATMRARPGRDRNRENAPDVTPSA